MSDTGDHEFLAIRQSPFKQGRMVLLSAACVAYGALALSASDVQWLGIAGVVVFGTIVLIGIVGLIRATRSGPELLLNHEGITVPNHPMIPWDVLSEVRVAKLIPWSFIPMGDMNKVIAFVPRHGVTLPPLPSAPKLGWLQDRAEHQRLRRYGTQLIVLPSVSTVSSSDLLAAVRGFSTTPIM